MQGDRSWSWQAQSSRTSSLVVMATVNEAVPAASAIYRERLRACRAGRHALVSTLVPRSLTKPSTGDLVAGLSVALVALPQSLAYAELAGLPAQLGLFASALPSILAAAFVSSRYLQTGPVALTALLTFGVLTPLADEGTPEYIAMAALLALLVGVFRVLLGLIHMGRVAYLLSEPVLIGFTTGAAIIIISSQIPRLFDYDAGEGSTLENAAEALVSPGDWALGAIGFSVLTWICVFGGRRLHRLVPGVLIAVVLGVIISSAIDFDGTTVGELDGGFLSLQFDFPWDRTGDLVIGAIAIALVGFAEPSSIARTFAATERQPWNADKEMISQGVANLAAAVSGAFPVGGSFSRSSLNHMAGATSPWAGAITGLIVLAALPLMPVLEPLPSAILGAIVVGAVVKLIRIGDLIGLIRQSAPQAVVGLGTLLATLLSAPRVERGVLIGIGLALSVHLIRELRVTAKSHVDDGLLTIEPQGVLWFATVPQIEKLMRDAVTENPDIGAISIDLAGVGRLDYTGAVTLKRVVEEFSLAGLVVIICNVPPAAQRAVSIHLGEHCAEVD